MEARDAFVGALIVGVSPALAIAFYPEAEVFLIDVIVVQGLVVRPRSLLPATTI